MRLYRLAPAPTELTPTTRAYASSLTDAEWAVLEPLVPRPATPQGGRPPKYSPRRIIDAIRYLVRSGCAWRLLPRDFPPPGTVYWWFAKWAADGTLERIHDGLRERVREAAGRRAAPSAAVVDSQSVRAADTVGKHSRGWDAGKKVNGRKRHLAGDTMGLLLCGRATAPRVQDRDAGRALLWRLPAHHAAMATWAMVAVMTPTSCSAPSTTIHPDQHRITGLKHTLRPGPARGRSWAMLPGGSTHSSGLTSSVARSLIRKAHAVRPAAYTAAGQDQPPGRRPDGGRFLESITSATTRRDS